MNSTIEPTVLIQQQNQNQQIGINCIIYKNDSTIEPKQHNNHKIDIKQTKLIPQQDQHKLKESKQYNTYFHIIDAYKLKNRIFNSNLTRIKCK